MLNLAAFLESYVNKIEDDSCKAAVSLITSNNKLIVKNIRNTKGRILATLVAVANPQNGGCLIGWSKCKVGDKFNRQRGLVKAISRSVPYVTIAQVYRSGGIDNIGAWTDIFGSEAIVPNIVRENIGDFFERVSRWAKKSLDAPQ